MKIRKLNIKNYKVFDDVEFDFTDADGKTTELPKFFSMLRQLFGIV